MHSCNVSLSLFNIGKRKRNYIIRFIKHSIPQSKVLLHIHPTFHRSIRRLTDPQCHFGTECRLFINKFRQSLSAYTKHTCSLGYRQVSWFQTSNSAYPLLVHAVCNRASSYPEEKHWHPACLAFFQT